MIPKAILFIIVLTAINSLVLQNVSALEISLDSPEEAELNSAFTVSISADSAEVYDVKVFVHNSEDDKIDRNEYISEIYYGGWQDSYLYIKGSFPEKTDYKIRVLESPGEREICARLRKTGTTAFSTQCNIINIIGSENSEEDKVIEKASNKENQEKVTTSEEIIPISKTPNQETQNLSYKSEEKILLNSKLSKETGFKNSVTTPESGKRKILIYGFTGFCVLIIILLALRKL